VSLPGEEGTGPGSWPAGTPGPVVPTPWGPDAPRPGAFPPPPPPPPPAASPFVGRPDAALPPLDAAVLHPEAAAPRRGGDTSVYPVAAPPEEAEPQRAWWGDTQVYMSLYMPAFAPPPPPPDDYTATTVLLRPHGDSSPASAEPGSDAAAALNAQIESRMENVGRNSAIQAAGTLASRVLGLIRTVLLAVVMGGMSLTNDSFTAAHNLPNQIFIIVSSGALTAVLIPQITKAIRQRDGGQDFVDRLVSLAVLGLAGITVVCVAAAPWITRAMVASSVNASVPGYLRLTVIFAYWCMPQIFFYGLFAVLGNVLNARGRFGEFAWAPAWANLIQITGLLAFFGLWHRQPDPATWTGAMIVVMAGSTTLSIAVQALCLIPPLVKDGFTWRLRLGWRGYGFGSVSRLVGWTLATNAVSQLVGFYAMRSMIAVRGDLPVAGTASQANAFLLFMLPHSMITVSIITSLFPMVARAWQETDLGRLRALIRRFLTEPAVLVIPASVALIALGSPIIRTIFRSVYLSISGAEVTNIWLLLAVLAVGLVFFGVASSAMRYYFAIEAGRTYFWFNGIVPVTQLIACGLALTIVPPFWGVAVICAGSTVGWIVQAGVFMAMARRQVGDYDLAGVIRLWSRLAIAAVAAGVAGYGVVRALDLVSAARLFQPVVLLGSALVFGGVFWLGARLLHITEVLSLVQGLAGRVMRRR